MNATQWVVDNCRFAKTDEPKERRTEENSIETLLDVDANSVGWYSLTSEQRDALADAVFDGLARSYRLGREGADSKEVGKPPADLPKDADAPERKDDGGGEKSGLYRHEIQSMLGQNIQGLNKLSQSELLSLLSALLAYADKLRNLAVEQIEEPASGRTALSRWIGRHCKFARNPASILARD